MKHYLIPIVGLAGILLTACSTPPLPPNRLLDSYCDLSFPILLDKDEIPLLTQETKRQILVLNRIWKQKCSPKPE